MKKNYFLFINLEKVKTDYEYYKLALIFNITLFLIPIVSIKSNGFNLNSSHTINSIVISISLIVLLIYLIKLKKNFKDKI